MNNNPTFSHCKVFYYERNPEDLNKYNKEVMCDVCNKKDMCYNCLNCCQNVCKKCECDCQKYNFNEMCFTCGEEKMCHNCTGCCQTLCKNCICDCN